MLGYVQALKNNRTAAVESIERMVAKDVGHTLTFVYEARIRFALGDFEIGYELLEKAVGRRAPDLLAISIDPRWRGVRRQDRFSKVVKEVTGQLGLDPDPGTWEMKNSLPDHSERLSNGVVTCSSEQAGSGNSN